MALWQITDRGPVRIPETRLTREKMLEENLEDWIEKDSSLLGERLLIIGRQVLIPDIKDKLDILALDTQGNAVIVELKREDLKDPVDVQALRYASYISKWRFEDFENQARKHFRKVGDPDFNFNSIYEEFCREEAEADEIPALNGDQRIFVVGTSVREKLGSVALWLREHSVDISVIEFHFFREGNTILAQPNVIVPVPVSRFADTGRMRLEGSPWIVDGKSWHLEKRCSPQTAEMLLRLDKILGEKFELDGPHWNQKWYVSYRIGNHTWLAVHTKPSSLRLDFFVRPGVFTTDQLAQSLNISVFDKDETLAEKLGLPSSVIVRQERETVDRILVRAKEGFPFESEPFTSFLEKAYKAFPKTRG